MIILTLRTDKPEAEIGLYDNNRQLAYHSWEAHRELADTIHVQIRDLLNDKQLDWKNVEGIVVYQGPGSFTGLRIGITVANALADSLMIPIVGSTGDDWIEAGLKKLWAGEDQKLIIPEYGAEPKTTQPKH